MLHRISPVRVAVHDNRTDHTVDQGNRARVAEAAHRIRQRRMVDRLRHIHTAILAALRTSHRLGREVVQKNQHRAAEVVLHTPNDLGAVLTIRQRLEVAVILLPAPTPAPKNVNGPC